MSSCYCRLPSGQGAVNFQAQPWTRRRAAGIVWLDRVRNRRPEIALRTPSSSGKFLVRVSARERGDSGKERQQKAGPCSYAIDDSEASGGGLDRAVEVGRIWRWRFEKRAVEVAAAFAVTVVLGVGNRVLYKLALVPLSRDGKTMLLLGK